MNTLSFSNSSLTFFSLHSRIDSITTISSNIPPALAPRTATCHTFRYAKPSPSSELSPLLPPPGDGVEVEFLWHMARSGLSASAASSCTWRSRISSLPPIVSRSPGSQLPPTAHIHVSSAPLEHDSKGAFSAGVSIYRR